VTGPRPYFSAVAVAGCALAVAPRGLHHRTEVGLARIGIGYDASPEAEAALTLAGSLAHATGAQLHVHAVVDDRGVPPIDWSTFEGSPPVAERDSYVRADVDLLRERTMEAIQTVDPNAEVAVHRGRPADALLELSAHVDLIVIGSRRWDRSHGCCSAAPAKPAARRTLPGPRRTASRNPSASRQVMR